MSAIVLGLAATAIRAPRSYHFIPPERLSQWLVCEFRKF